MRTIKLLLAGIASLVVLVWAAPALAVTKTVSLDDLPPETTVQDQYRDSHGVYFRGPAVGDSAFPITKALSPGLAHSGNQVADVSYCFGCEFWTPRSIGRLTSTATSISAFVGYIGAAAGNPPVDVTLTAFDASGGVLGSSSATVTQGQPFSQIVSVTSPNGAADIASFAIEGTQNSAATVGFDDLSITYPDGAAPPDFSLGVGESPTDVSRGDFVDVPVEVNRLNGSNGDVAMSVAGLPQGMSGSFTPNPVPGTDGTATLRLTAEQNATPSPGEYTEITITGTPGPGAGSAPRIVKRRVRIVENCVREVRVDYIHATSKGCMRRRGPDVVVVPDQTVYINGLAVAPPAGTTGLRIDKKARTISGDTGAPYAIGLADRPGLLLYAGTIDWDLGSGSGDGPRKIIEYGAPDSSFLGMRIKKVEVSLTKAGKAQVNPTFKLEFWPFNYFGAITATSGFSTGNDSGSDFNTLEIEADKVPVKALELKDVAIKWKQGTSWSGKAMIGLRFVDTVSIGGGLGVKNGGLEFLEASVGNINAPVSPGVHLQSIGLGATSNPYALSGRIGFSAGPSIAGKKAVTVNGGFKAVLDDPFVVELTGDAKLADRFELGNVFLRYSSDGLFELGGKLDWDLGAGYLNGEVTGFVDGFDAASLEGRVRGCIRIPWAPDPCAGAALIASNIGIAACVDITIAAAGIGYFWGGDVDLWWGSCDLGRWRPARSSTGTAQNGPQRFTLRRRLSRAAFAIEGEGDAPGVTLTGPGGETISVSAAQPTARVGRLFAVRAGNGITYVTVDRPAAGVWTLSDDGAVPVRRIRQAFGLPKPSVRASVTGQGRKRTLRWRLKPISGQRVRFVEMGRDVRNVIATTSARSGAARFRPADGSGGRRRIVALVEQDGVPRVSLAAGSYRAPARPRPERPRRVRISRRGKRLVVSWRAPEPGFRHVVRLVVGDGREVVRGASARARSITVRRVARGYGARATVTGLTHANGRGRSARAAIKGALPGRPAGGAWKLLKRFDYVRKGSFGVAEGGRSVSTLRLTPGPAARKGCGDAELRIAVRRRLSTATRAGLSSWVVGRKSARSADGVTAIRVTVRRGRKRVRGQLKLLFDGPRRGTGELTMRGCRMFFKTKVS